MSDAGNFSISPNESRLFAELSGDFNPLHLDPVEARRQIFGGTVPHGVHVLAKALDLALANGDENLALSSLKVNFSAPAVHGRTMSVKISWEGAGRLRLDVYNDDITVLTATATFTHANDEPSTNIADHVANPTTPRDGIIADAVGLRGETPLFLPRRHLFRLFPTLSRCLPGRQLANLFASTKIIGMDYPGLRSVFVSIELAFSTPETTEAILRFQVERADSRLSMAKLKLSGPGVTGHITGLFRPAATKQLSAADIHRQVPIGKFRSHRALIIGGSRGLGEVTAKILAAGGADVWITYAIGNADANAVIADIRAFTDRCGLFRFDVTDPPVAIDGAPPPEGWSPTHLYYFATPSIQITKGRSWDSAKFDRYASVYVHGLAKTVAAVTRLFPAPPRLTLYYPSTTFLDSPPPGTAEYIAAKAAGESLCHVLATTYPFIEPKIYRFPPLRTDQTTTLRGAAGGDPVPTLMGSLTNLDRS